MKVKVSFVLLVLVLMTMPFVLAFSPLPTVGLQTTSIDVISVVLTIAVGFAALVGVSKLVPVVVQLLKVLGLVRNGTADQWAAGLNLVSFFVLVYFGVFQPQLSIAVLDGYAGQIAEILLFVLGLIIQLTGSKPTYDQLKASRIPLLSFSYSDQPKG